MRKLIVMFELLSVAATLALAAAPSQATAPGTNGRIAFRRYFDKAHAWGAVFTINAVGTGERQVTHPPKKTVDDQPDWAQNDSLLVFSRTHSGGSGAIYTVRPDGSQLKRLSPPCPQKPAKCEDDFVPTFSPDGQRVAFGSFSGKTGASIVTTDRAGHNRRVVVRGTKAYALGDPQFSPDGRRLVFQRSRKPAERVQGLAIVNLDGTGTQQLTPSRLAAGDGPDWSPDGKWILFRSNVDLDAKQSQIYVVHPDGTGLKQLSHFKQGTIVTSSSFSPDGKSIVLGTTGLGGNADLYVMRADGSNMHPITRTRLWDSAPDWGPA